MKGKLLFFLIVFFGLVISVVCADTTNKYLYGEASIKIKIPWFLQAVHARNFTNEEYVSLMLAPQKPLDLPIHFTMDMGLSIRNFQYDKWDEELKEIKQKDEQLFEFLVAPEVDLNWRFLNFRARDEVKINKDGRLNDNLLFAQIRAYPHRLLWGEISYSTFDAGNLGGVRLEGISSEARARVSTVLFSALEIGLQFTSAYYQSEEEIWESEYRPDGGIFLRITRLPFWLELSWERLKVKEKDLRIGKALPTFDQDRVFIACGFTQDPKYVRR